MLITKYLENNAKNYKEEVALIEISEKIEEHQHTTWKDFPLVVDNNQSSRREITWGQFNDEANRFANALLKYGIKKGDKVAILMFNCLEWLPIYFGILKTGAIVVPFNYRYSSDEIEYCLNLADVDLLVFGDQFIGRLENIFDRQTKVKAFIHVGKNPPSFAIPYDEFTLDASRENPNINLTLEDEAAIYFSSGTTGFPKAILHKQKSLSHAAIVEQKHHGQCKEDKFLCIPPLYHTGAKMHWFGSLVSASPAVLLKGVSPKLIIETVSKEKCTIVWLLVPWAQDILDQIEDGEIDLDEYELKQWRLMHIGAQPVPPSLIRRWKKVFPNHDYDTNYGLSESIGPGCVHLGVENIDHVGAIGVPGFGWEVEIVNNKGEVIPDGEVGELCVKGDGVMVCYYKDKKSTDETIIDGWLCTGDMAKRENGFIYLVDRKKDVIITGGENIYPVQIEDFLRKNEKIKDAAVIGKFHERLGEIAIAIIEKRDKSLTTEEIEEFVKELPKYKRPKEIIFDKVVRNATGKIEKVKLRKKYCGNIIEQQIK